MLALTADQLDTVRRILLRHLPGREVRAFGSRVSGTARKFSDLDLVVMGDEPVSELVKMTIDADLDDSDLPFRVDVLDWHGTPGSLREVIRNDSEVIAP